MRRTELFLVVPAVLSMGLPHVLPAKWFFDVHAVSYDAARNVVVQDRTVSVEMHADWRASVFHLADGRWALVCSGGGGDFPYHRGRLAAAMSLDVWVGDPGCQARMDPGDVYRLSASWTFGPLVWRWTARHEGTPFTYQPQEATE